MELADLIVGQKSLNKEIGELVNNKYQYLPACMIEPVFKDYYEQIIKIAEVQLNEANEVIKNREKEPKENNEKKGGK